MVWVTLAPALARLNAKGQRSIVNVLIAQAPDCFLMLRNEHIIQLYNLARHGSRMRRFFKCIFLENLADEPNEFGNLRYWFGDMTAEKPPMSKTPIRPQTQLFNLLLQRLLAAASAGNEFIQVYEIAMLVGDKKTATKAVNQIAKLESEGDMAFLDYLAVARRSVSFGPTRDWRLEVTLLKKIFKNFQSGTGLSLERMLAHAEAVCEGTLLAKILEAMIAKDLTIETVAGFLDEDSDAAKFQQDLWQEIDTARLGAGNQ